MGILASMRSRPWSAVPGALESSRRRALFGYVRERGAQVAVDRCCVFAILTAARALPEDVAVSLNIHASSLASDPEMLNILADACEVNFISLSRVIVEIIPDEECVDVPLFGQVLDDLRRIGVRIALDDVGHGYSNYWAMAVGQPDYLKLDRRLVHDCHTHHYRLAVLESIVGLSEKFGARVVAKGVESNSELNTLATAGLDLFQGFFFCPPLSGAEVGRCALPSLHWQTPTRSVQAGRKGN